MSALAHDDEHESPRRPKNRSRIGSKNHLTLPDYVLDAANLKPGDEVHFKVDGDGVIRILRGRDEWVELHEKFVGSSPGLSAVANLQGLRNEWER